MNYPVHIVSVFGLIENSEGKITYGVFSRNPYVLHEVQYL